MPPEDSASSDQSASPQVKPTIKVMEITLPAAEVEVQELPSAVAGLSPRVFGASEVAQSVSLSNSQVAPSTMNRGSTAEVQTGHLQSSIATPASGGSSTATPASHSAPVLQAALQTASNQTASTEKAPAQSATARSTSTQPTPGQIATATPTGDQCKVAQPATIQPTTIGLTTARPARTKQAAAQTTPARPSTAQSTATLPTAAEPTATQPTPVEPNTLQPTTAHPKQTQQTATQATPAQPSTAQSTPKQPTATEPTATQPTTTSAKQTQPTTTQPSTAGPTSQAAKPSSLQRAPFQPTPVRAAATTPVKPDPDRPSTPTTKPPLQAAGTGFVLKTAFAYNGSPLSLEFVLEKLKSGEWRFCGGTPANEPIALDVESVLHAFGVGNDQVKDVPAALLGLAVNGIGIQYNTADKSASFSLQVTIEELDVTLVVLASAAGDVGLRLVIADVAFDLAKTSAGFHASLDNRERKALKLSDLVGAVPNEMDFSITPRRAFFAYAQDSTQQKVVILGLEIDSPLDLSQLPFVGDKIPAEAAIGVEGIRLLYLSRAVTVADSTAIAELDLPQRSALPKGINVSIQLNLAGEKISFQLPLSGKKRAGRKSRPAAPKGLTTTKEPSAEAPSSSPGFSKWFNVNKTLGPVTLNKVGVSYGDQRLGLMLDAALAAGGLSLAVKGLGASFDVFALMRQQWDAVQPEFRLQGLAVSFASGPVRIGGAFLYRQILVEGETVDEFSGGVLIQVPAFTLSAIGSYCQLRGEPSVFIYGVLEMPLGGPAFFFVTGLALGFGYNRSLVMPALDQVANFPLVKIAMGGGPPRAASASPGGDANLLLQVLDSLAVYVPPATGEIFLVVGVKFSSFKLIDSFLLLAVQFGDEFELNLLGISKLVVPPVAGVPPVVEVQIALRGQFNPSRGILQVEGMILPGSYILSRDCKLGGGFAFYCWFSGEHAGDFVFTIGGYHPKFKAPSHYPNVDRLSLSWQVIPELHIKGTAYFALTSSAVMAGGGMEAIWQSGSLRAWFIMQADFIIAWKPFFYDLAAKVSIGVSYTFSIAGLRKSISISFGVDLHIWGPEFTGTAKIDWVVISFTIRFGSSSPPLPDPIPWSEFQSSFIPKPEEVCGLSVGSGLEREVEEGGKKRWVVNPKEFVLTTNSVIPSSSWRIETSAAAKQALAEATQGGPELAIGPMRLSSLASEHSIEITSAGAGRVEDRFEFTPIFKSVPSALWGPRFEPDLNGKPIARTLAGFSIRSAQPPTAGKTRALPCSSLQFNPEGHPGRFAWHNKLQDPAPVADADEWFRELTAVARDRGERITPEHPALADLACPPQEVEL